MSLEPRHLAAQAAAELCVELTERRRPLGVFLEHLPQLDQRSFLSALSEKSTRKLRVAILGTRSNGDGKVPARLELTYSPTRANEWRNDLTARGGTPCVTLVVGSAPKLNSLRSAFHLVGPADLRAAVCRRALALLETPERRGLWRVLMERTSEVPLQNLLDFAAAVEGGATRSPAAIVEREAALVHLLGLLQQPGLTTSSGVRGVLRHLKVNLETVKRIRRLSTKDRKSLSAWLGEESRGTEHGREAARRILKFERSGAREDLEGLDYAAVVAALKGPQARPSAAAEVDDDDRAPPNKRERVDGDALALDLLLEEDGRGLGVAAQRYRESVAPDEEDDISPEEVKVGSRVVLPRVKTGTAQATSTFGKVIAKDVWGGLVRADASDYVAALKMLASGDAEFLPFEPNASDGVRGIIHRAVDHGIAPGAALKKWDAYAAARAILLPHAAELVDHPLLALAGSAKLREKAEELLSAYAAALAAVADVAEALKRHGSSEPAKRLRARALCLDVAFVQSSNDTHAVAAPTHPFHLWRWLSFYEVIGEHKDDLKEIGSDVLHLLVTDPPATAPHVVLSPFAIDGPVGGTKVYVPIGAFGALPLFGESTTRHLGKFRARSLRRLAERLLQLMPHASFGLSIALIDPPSVPGALEDIRDLRSVFDEDAIVPVHTSILRTRPAQETTDEEDQDVEAIVRELRDNGGSMSVWSGSKPLKEIAEHLGKHPVHLAVVFDPGEGQEFRVGLSSPPSLSPLVLPRAYRYDQFDDRLDVVVAGESPAFGKYHELFCELLDAPRSDFVGRRSGASRSVRELAMIARNTMWLVVADQAVEPTFRIEGAMRLAARTDGGRDVVTFTAHHETVEELIADAVRLVGLRADEETIKRTLRDTFELNSEALLLLARATPSVSLADGRIAKGLVGTLAAARWYTKTYPDALLISLDDETSRRWIYGRDGDNRRGDLLGVRPKGGGIIVEAVEVKTHDDDMAAVSVSGGRLEGRAAVQVDQTIRALKRILSPGAAPSALGRARQDVLRDQLYRAVAARPYGRDTRARLVNLLESLFSEGPAELGGLIFRVKVVSGGAARTPSAPKPARSPDGNLVGIVDLDESEAEGAPGGRQDGGKGKPPSRGGGDGGPSGGQGGGGSGGAKREGKRQSPPATVAAPAGGRTPEPAASGEAQPLSILIGSTGSEREVRWEPHRPDAPLKNFGLLVTGDPGAGKTQVLRVFISEIARHGVPVCIFDFKNDYSDPDFGRAVQLTVYDVDRNGLPFNPLSLVPDERGEVQPVRQIHELAAILRRIFGLGDQQEARLKRALRQAYEARGIKPDVRQVAAALSPAPSFGEVVEVLRAEERNEALLNRLAPLFDLNLFPSSDEERSSFEELLSSRVVLDLHSLPDDRIKAALAEFLIVRLHGYVLRGDQPRRLRRFLVFDEAWRVKDSVRLQELAREGRAFGVGIAVGTQFPGDIPENLAGNLATQLLLQNSQADHRKSIVRTLLGSTAGAPAQQLMNQIDRLRKHEGFFRNEHYAPYVFVETLPYWKRVAPETQALPAAEEPRGDE